MDVNIQRIRRIRLIVSDI